MPYFTFTPASGSTSRVRKAGTAGSIDPYCTAVKVGRNSRFRLVEMSVIPSRIPIWAKKLASSRDMGDQTWFS